MQSSKTFLDKANHNSKVNRPENLYFRKRFTCDENVNFTLNSSSSEDINSPVDDNYCEQNSTVDKPITLVKRFTMGFLRMNEESRPLVARHQRSSPNSPARRGYFYHYINAGIYDVDNKFGDSCRQSLDGIETTNINKNNIEFDFKRNLMRETSSANCSPKKFMSTTLKRTDSLNANHTLMDDDDNEFELKEATWFQSGPHEISLEVLAQQSPGAFLVRKSAKSGCFALSVRVPTPGPKVRHYLIMRTARGYKIKGFTKEFSSLRALITHHSVMPELLPVPLALPRPQNIPKKSKNDDYDTYSTLKDLKSIFSDLDVCS